MSNVLTDLIVYVSPFAGALIAWFIINHISDVKDQITEVKGKIGGVSTELQDVKISMVKIQSDIEHIKESGNIEKDKTNRFENQVVKILRNAKQKFE